jgi:hypothetical protein
VVTFTAMILLVRGAALISVGLVGLACQSSTSTYEVAPSAAPTTTASAASVRMNGGVGVGRVDIPAGGGFVAVYDDESGVPGLRLGASSRLEAGWATGVRIDAPGAGAVWVLVHRDVDGDASLRYPGPDVPVVDPSTGAVRADLIRPVKVGDPPR